MYELSGEGVLEQQHTVQWFLLMTFGTDESIFWTLFFNSLVEVASTACLSTVPIMLVFILCDVEDNLVGTSVLLLG